MTADTSQNYSDGEDAQLSRPPITTSSSTPNLIRSLAGLEDQSRGTPEQGVKEHTHLFQPPAIGELGKYDILDWFSFRHSDDYRAARINIPEDRDPKLITKSKYKKRVSFDTINLQYNDDFDDEDGEDDWGMNGFVDRGRGREKSRSPSMSLSRHYSVSPSRRMPSPLRNGGIDFTNIDIARLIKPMRTDYPTRPIITHRGCTFTKLHRDFENLYLAKIPQRPVLPRRTILVYVSARKHTWVALDWVLSTFIEHGDTVIVVSAIKSEQFVCTRRRLSQFSPQRTPAMTPRMRLRQRNRPEYTKIIAKNLMTYIMEVMNPDVITKVSLELAVGKTKDVLKEMYKLYEPNLVCTATKQNLRISAPLKSWISSKLTDRLVKNFPLPVIVVPAMNMNDFERKLVQKIEKRYESSPEQIVQKVPEVSPELEKKLINDDDAASINSSDSFSSNDSYSSYDEISKLYVDYKQDLESNIKLLAKEPLNEDFYASFARIVTDKSARLCQEIREIDPDTRGKGAKLAEVITGANSFGMAARKTKSLLEPIEKSKSETPSLGPGLSFKEMKRNLMLNQEKSSPQSPKSPSPAPAVPQISVHSPSEETSAPDPRKSALKFVNLESPSAAKQQQGEQKKKEVSNHKSASLEIERQSSRPKLKPLSSHPDITSHSSLNSGSSDSLGKPKKSKLKRFWKLFS
ncbi:uncharacterized protein CANTADRAFT_24388 [Suhomyces tanzawaensis NRRL Y-17324]|uniref:UspA domain-containing protein n=1 Tax=Suhomyces tanzawaensis NRRL Y-17324 TaxID=984487 RepID=A0A1E4SPM6_9ASCO|nr:uncharacterized protein CANTADRAFT_24388 [Suhomyces tanzawaensis NRRL Y-17324]ODV81445.1 hypothetical protein CANTADRAFT_24388 [Suhomyces tanzawaensis NRRL Y-17324]